MSVIDIAQRIQELPADAQRVVEELVTILASRQPPSTIPKMTFSWAGGLSDLRDQYTSVQLQKKALEWMSKI
jgi:hypothetical protein